MEFEKIKFNQIEPSDYNPRKISKTEFTRLSQNLKEFGLVDPIIINLKNNHIVGGHQRYSALYDKYTKTGKLDEITLNLIRLGDVGWVFETDKLEIKDDDHEKSLNVSLNKISGEWDYNKLSKVFNDLVVDGFDTDLTGFTSFEIEKYTLPTDLNLEFMEMEESEEENKKQTEAKKEVETKEEKKPKNKCPNCGHEW